jgi:tetratricopeptide (TPR) repeat protein
MLRKYFSMALAAGFLTLTAVVATAQTGELRGHVKLKQADGTTVPAAGAAIDVFRTDIKGGEYKTKTDKKGTFVFAGLPYVGDYIIGVSAPGGQPNFKVGVKAGRDMDFELVMEPGDGRRLTLAEINALMKGSGGSTAAGASSESASDKAKRAEIDAKNKEIIEKNKKVEESNSVVARTFKAGNDALIAAGELTKAGKRDESIAKYTEAIAHYDEGLAADAEQPALLTNKALALKARGVDRFNAAITATDPATKAPKLEEAKADFKTAAETTQKALALLKAEAGAAGDPASQARVSANRLSALSAHADAMRLYVSKSDGSQADAGLTAFEEYIAAEPDAAKKAKALRDSAQMMLDAGVLDKAQVQYEKVLAANPSDVDALQKLGVILISQGEIMDVEGKKEEGKTKMSQGLGYLQQYVDKGPDGQLKTESKDTIENYERNRNIKAEKPAATPARRRKP